MPKVYINCPVSRALTELKLCDTLYTTRFKSAFTVFRESVFYVAPDVNQSTPRFAQWLKRHTRVESRVVDEKKNKVELQHVADGKKQLVTCSDLVSNREEVLRLREKM